MVDIQFKTEVQSDCLNKNGTTHVSGTFCYKGKWYWADVCYVPFIGNECMIFESTDNGKVTNWSDLYCNREVEVSEESLTNCIEEFCKEFDNEMA